MHRISILALAAFAVSTLHAQQNPFSDDARQSYALVKSSILKAADKMPAEDYSFHTVPEVRTFAQMIAHVADAQFRMCGTVKGESPAQDALKKSRRPTWRQF